MFVATCHKDLADIHAQPTLYLPKMEGRFETEWWAKLFQAYAAMLGIDPKVIRSTTMIEVRLDHTFVEGSPSLGRHVYRCPAYPLLISCLPDCGSVADHHGEHGEGRDELHPASALAGPEQGPLRLPLQLHQATHAAQEPAGETSSMYCIQPMRLVPAFLWQPMLEPHSHPRLWCLVFAARWCCCARRWRAGTRVWPSRTASSCCPTTSTRPWARPSSRPTPTTPRRSTSSADSTRYVPPPQTSIAPSVPG